MKTLTRCRDPIEPPESLERRILLATYGPDVSFGNGGHVIVPSGILVDPLPNGQILVAGNRLVPGTGVDDSPAEYTTIASRINSIGTIDATFGSGGMVDLGGAEGIGGTDGVAFTGSRLYLGGNQLRAYKLDGSPDTGFSSDGVLDIPTTFPVDRQRDTVTGFLVNTPTPGGELLLLVSTEVSNSGTISVELTEIKPDGTIDTAFGDNGFVVIADADAPRNIIPTAAGLLFVRRQPDESVEISRYHADGKTLDSNFGTAGKIALASNPFGFFEQSDGKLLFVDTTQASDPSIHRLREFNADGSPDGTFGSAGIVILPNPAGDLTQNAVITVDSQKRILVGGFSQLYRFSPTGVLDATLHVTIAATSTATIALDSNGRILTGADFGASALLTRYDTLAPIEIGRNHVLYVEGTANSDQVAINAGDAGKIDVTRNGTVSSINAAGIVGLAIHLDDGNDAAAVSLDLPATVTGGAGDDTITTAAGADSILGGAGNDSVISAAGNDTVAGGAGNDALITGEGDDSLSVGSGDNLVDCGAGNDSIANFELEGNGHNIINGGNGNKRIELLDSSQLDITLGVGDSRINLGGAVRDDHVTIAGGNNDVTASGGHDTVAIGGTGKNHVFIAADSTADVTAGDGADDFYILGSGTIHSNGGNDTFNIETGIADGPTLVFAGDGNDRVVMGLENSGVNVATVHGGNGNDYMQGAGGAQIFYGEAGNDTLFGGDGSDLLSGGGGNDRLFGEAGKDRIYGGAGRDRIYGGGGDDRAFGGAGSDWIYSQGGNDQLIGQGGNDRLYADYATGNSTFHGGAGDDLLVSKNSLIDHLFGDAGRDTAIADDNDVLTSVESIG